MTELEKLRKEIDLIDENMARLFEYRLDEVRRVAEYKAANGLPVNDKEREKKMISRNSKLIKNPNYRDYYSRFLNHIISISCDFQKVYNKKDKDKKDK